MAARSPKPKIGKPMAARKTARNPKPRGPARTAKTVVTGQRCEREHCGRAATAFRQGQHVCPSHTPAGDPNCTHSLGNPCAYCGAVLE